MKRISTSLRVRQPEVPSGAANGTVRISAQKSFSNLPMNPRGIASHFT
jgi:hypothetical protein